MADLIKVANSNWERTAPVTYELECLKDIQGSYVIRAADGNLYAYLSRGRLTVYTGYQCNGCSWSPDIPKGSMLAKLFGGSALEGCEAHDAMTQLQELYPQIPKETVDAVLSEVQGLHNLNGTVRSIYHRAVSGFGNKIYRFFNS